MPLLLFVGKPISANLILLFTGWYESVIVAIQCLTVGASAAVRDPNAGAGTHDGFEHRNESTRWMLDFDSAVAGAIVNIWLPVCEDDHLLSMQVPVESLLNAFRCPQPGSIFCAMNVQRLPLAGAGQIWIPD